MKSKKRATRLMRGAQESFSVTHGETYAIGFYLRVMEILTPALKLIYNLITTFNLKRNPVMPSKRKVLLSAAAVVFLIPAGIWFFTPPGVYTARTAESAVPVVASAAPQSQAWKQMLNPIETDAVARCTAERGGKAPEFGQTGLGCYVYFPSNQHFEVPPPPKTNEGEAAALVEMKSRRTPAVLAAINDQAVDPMPSFWKASGIDPLKHPKFADTVRMALNDAANLTLKIKHSFNRARPHTVNPAVAPVIEVPWHSAYPSGHATNAALVAHILACANPSTKSAVGQLAEQVGRNREIAGVHYPSDTDAGFRLGKAIFDELKKNPKFSCTL
ncbi:MAG: phosphatase PAP2 family protein [Burkholderiales bacterium]|nr:phosphatase PAP2 family protein [Burkholderiales bacterium]